MNNVSCEIIQDLLPLYCDGVCSEESKEAILAHVQTCEKCRDELRVMDIPIDITERIEEVETAEAASRAWKKNKKKAFRMGIILAALLVVIAAAIFFGSHYMRTVAADDVAGLKQQLEADWEVNDQQMLNLQVERIVQKGDYLAVSACADTGRWYLGVYKRDKIFPDRWEISGGSGKVRPGYLTNWNYETPEGDTILVCFGAELAENIGGYTFTNSGVTYTCPVTEDNVLDFFFIPDAYDSRTHLEPIYQP